MSASSTPRTYFHHTAENTWIVERAVRGAKLLFSVMPRRGPGGDVPVPPKRVPQNIRHAARKHFDANPRPVRSRA